MSNATHIRYQCWSKPFHDLLSEKGFREGRPEKKNQLHEVRIFTLRDMTIKSSLRSLTLIKADDKGNDLTIFSGASIHDKILLSFIGLPIRKGKQDEKSI